MTKVVDANIASSLRSASNHQSTCRYRRTDGRALKRILLKLLTSAIKFTPKGGAVTVAVSDTGIGMSEVEVARALTPFGQIDSKLARKHEGTGLGLPITRSLVKLHGGDIAIVSEPNKGTTITASFPASRVVRTAA